jgi:hypothetical protein
MMNGFKNRTVQMPRARRWTTSENDLIKTLAARRPAAEIAKRLGRSLGATFVQASKLNVSLRVPGQRSKMDRSREDTTAIAMPDTMAD